jgi:hypothetical protein
MREQESKSEAAETTVGPNFGHLQARLLLPGALIFAGTLTVLLLVASRNFGLSAPPENGGDSDSYERLGYNLAAGSGFGYCPSDTLILAGTAEPTAVERCEAGCDAQEFQVTAYRPPGFPFLIAAVYRFSPLNYLAVRILNCVACAAAVTWVSLWLARRHSVTAAFLASMTCCLDPRFREFAGSFLTENLATLGLCGFALSFAAFVEHKTISRAALCGLTLSALVMIRSFYVAWYPALWIGVAWVLWCSVRGGFQKRGEAIGVALAFCVCSLVLTGPWWVRNCIVLNAMMPTGTQGGIGIADGFSDSAMENFGSWTPRTADGILKELRADPEFAGLSGIEIEKEHCRRGAAHASEWIRSHPEKLLPLTWWKFSRLWEFGSLQHAALFGLCAVGMWFSRATPLCRILLLLFLLNSLTVMATYHTYERFLTPFRPLIHTMCAWGLSASVRTVRPSLFRSM